MEEITQDKLVIENITKNYDKKNVLDNISFSVKKGEFLSILGSSGCGKTTLLRIIMGIETADSGKIIKDGEDITSFLPSKRKMGMVFQNYALFPNMTAYKNIAYALKCQRVPKDEIKKRVDEVVKIVGLEEHINKKPANLSGGQQQRVALARTFVLNPDIILFDEPMSALDADIKMSLRQEIKDLQKKLDITMIYITHDQEEAFALSNRIMVMKDGNIEQIGSPKEIYNNPKTEYVKNFVVKHLDNKISSIQESIKWQKHWTS